MIPELYKMENTPTCEEIFALIEVFPVITSSITSYPMIGYDVIDDVTTWILESVNCI